MAENEIKNNEAKEGEGNVLSGFVLYKDANMDWNRFFKYLKEDWDIEVADEVKDDAVVFKIDDMMVACSLLPSPVPNKEAEEAANTNVFWKGGPEAVAEHNAQVLLAVMNKFDPYDQAILFAKVACCLLKLDNAIGIYKAPTCYEKQFYINFANSIKDDQTPMPILIHAGMYLTKTGLCAYTSGMRVLGYEEMEIIDSQLQPDQVIGILYAIAEYVVTEEAVLKNGETIGFTDDQKLPITVSAGVSVQGTTIKIGL
ncbi:MAG: DUF4261 domain-containing protein [Ruminococcus sp.]|nr:DUF4261 domain-containing protein [Ruminococcus sp.]